MRMMQKSWRRDGRGSVIVLVVAVLALLAVLGTVYIVSARTERTAAAAGSVAANLDLAQRGVDEAVRQIIGEPMYDQTGVVGGINAWTIQEFGDRMARWHDIPEFDQITPGYAFYNNSMRDQSWLVPDLYRASGAGFYANLTMPQTRVSNGAPTPIYSPSVFNPATGAYDLNLYTLDGTYAPTAAWRTFRAVADQVPSGADDDALVQLLPYSEANGTRYRYGIRILDTSRMENLNTGAIYLNSDPATLTAFRVAGTYNADYALNATTFNTTDTAANLNGTPGTGNSRRWGTFPAGANSPLDYWVDWSWGQATYVLEKPSLWPVALPFDLSDELELRAYGWLGTQVVPRPAVDYGSPIWPKTLGKGSANRQYYSAYTYSRDLRPYPDPYDSTGVLQAYRVGPAGGTGAWGNKATMAPSQINDGTGLGVGIVWPPYPARVAALPDISAYTSLSATQAADAIVVAAVNIATAMQALGPTTPVNTQFSGDEARAFAANYLTSRWNSWADLGLKKVGSVTANHVYSLYAAGSTFGGPSFIESTGLHLRTGLDPATFAGDYISTLNSTAANRMYVGYAAQPFINEVAVSIQVPTAATTFQLLDCAVELYNPYDVALSLADFELNVDGTEVPFGADDFIPARGYYVLTNTTGKLDTAPTNLGGAPFDTTVPHTSNSALVLTSAKKVCLMRKYNNGTAWAAVDQYDVTTIGTFPASGAAGDAEIDFVARANMPDDLSSGNRSRWVATVYDATNAPAKHKHTGTAPDKLTLGSVNDGANAVSSYVPLYDRVLDLTAANGAYDSSFQRLIPANINDFNRIMRICNVIDPSVAGKGLPPANGTVSEQLAQKISTPDARLATTQFPGDAGVHFDFYTQPQYYGGGTPATVTGDPAAIRLQSCLAFTDRLSDYTIDLGDNTTFRSIATGGTPYTAYDQGMSKLRIPGKINVNTASPEVLMSIPVLNSYPKLIGTILAYRWRARTDDVRLPALYQLTAPAVIDFTTAASNNYPGYGIRSLGELQIPIMEFQKAAGVSYTNIADRDALWGQMYNALTVRSDTFVVYAYLEAVRQNPKYGGPFNNSTDWYTMNRVPSNGAPGVGVTDDPSDSRNALLRVARRRWVAIVDRSNCNYSRNLLPYMALGTPQYILDPRFSKPQVVAERDLPQ
jgi:hypothetical protein